MAAGRSFVHLHVHTNFSFGDGACPIEELVQAAATAGMPAVAVTDHDGLYGAVRFYQACQKAGVKPIVGVELNVESALPERRGASAAPQSEPEQPQQLGPPPHDWLAAEPGQAGSRPVPASSVSSPLNSPPVRIDRPHQGYSGMLRGQTAAPGWHVVLLAKDYEGWSNLCRIISAAHLEHPGEPPYARWETIERHAGHLIALSSCRRGELGAALLAALENQGKAVRGSGARAVDAATARGNASGDRAGAGAAAARAASGAVSARSAAPDCAGEPLDAAGRRRLARSEEPRDAAGRRRLARRIAQQYAKTFGRGNYFIELQHELLPDSPQYVRELAALAHELKLPMVATNNVHYMRREDGALHDVLAAEAANQPLPNPLGRKNAELYFKSAAQMRRLFAAIPEAAENTLRIANRCNLDLGLGQLLFPAYPLPPGETSYSLLCKKCFAGAADRYRPVTPEVTARLQHELQVIQELNFAEYFLAVADIVDFTRANKIPYSGRGSAGNSIVSYVLHICDSDPIAHDLLFERFLNPYRREMPDVDIDFCSERREEVIDYIYQRFGHENVAMVATVNTAHAPSAVRIVAKAFGFRPDEIDRLSRKVPWGGAEKLGEMLAERPELADHEFQHPHYRRLVHLAEKLADFPMLLGTHLGGFILSREPLTNRVPLQWAAKGVVVAQFDKDDIETLGLVKMDILGLRMHSAIAETVRRVKDRTGIEISPWELPKEDPKVYELIRSARTLGLFQLESSGQRNLATRLKEREFEDVIAAISLFRPGPLQADMIAPFIRRRHGHEKPTVPHDSLWPALGKTYGIIIYQEQVISAASAVAGFSLADADMLRRAMTHDRSMEEMDEIGRTFVEKAVANGVERATAEEVFRQLRGFAAYGFNKAHAACFAIICNATAWLKAYYPAEFYCGLMNNQPMGFYSPRVVLNDARRFGLPVLPVDVNRSEEGFSVEVIDEANGAGAREGDAPGAGARDGGEPAVAQSSWSQTGPRRADPHPADPLRDASGRRLAVRVGLKYAKEMSGEAMYRIVSERGGIPRDILGRPVNGQLIGDKTNPQPEGKEEYQPAAGRPRPYTSFADFVARAQVSIEIAESLVRVGAFDALGTRREELLAQLPLLYAGMYGSRRGAKRQNHARSGLRERRGASAASVSRDRPGEASAAAIASKQSSVASSPGAQKSAAQEVADASQGEPLRLIPDQSEMPPLGFLPSWTIEERVRAELEVLGLNVSAHPLSLLHDELRALKVTPFDQLPRIRHGRRVRLAGVLERAQMPWIRSGHRTLFLTLEDETELAQVVVFNDVYLQYGRVLKNAIYLLVEGELQNDEEHGLAVVAKRVYDLLEVVRNGGGMPRAPRPIKHSADDHKGTPQPELPGGGGRHGAEVAAGTVIGGGRRGAEVAAGTGIGGGRHGAEVAANGNSRGRRDADLAAWSGDGGGSRIAVRDSRRAGSGDGIGDQRADRPPAADGHDTTAGGASERSRREPVSAGTPLGTGDNVYPWDGPAPEDTRLRPPTRRLTLPEIEPRTRPGRTG